MTFTAAEHATDTQERLDGIELAYPINIGSNVWFNTNSIILPDITYGDDVVFRACCVVTRNVNAFCML